MADTNSSRHRCILLTAEQAERVSAKPSDQHTITPLKHPDGRYTISAGYLDDPYAAEHIPFLMTLPQCDVVSTGTGYGQFFIDESSISAPDNTHRVYAPPPGKNPWVQPPFPPKGDWSEAALYEGVGRALSAWETFEHAFAILYSALLGPNVFNLPALRAYGSILTFQGREHMLGAASQAYFLVWPDTVVEAELRTLRNRASDYSARRNEIAHGVVNFYETSPSITRGLALHPSEYASNKTTIAGGKYPKVLEHASIPLTKPRYVYTTPELAFFTERFYELVDPTYELAEKLRRKPPPESLVAFYESP